MKRIYLIDSPGVVPPSITDSEQDILLRGVVRVENVENPEQYIAAVLERVKSQHIERTYDVKGFQTPTEFLELMARKSGRLLKGGEADVDGVAKMVLNDFLRGKVPWYVAPPIEEGKEGGGIEGRQGRLGEMGRKRKRDDETTNEDDAGIGHQEHDKAVEGLEDSFEGFESDQGELELDLKLGSDLEASTNEQLSEEDDDSVAETCATSLKDDDNGQQVQHGLNEDTSHPAPEEENRHKRQRRG